MRTRRGPKSTSGSSRRSSSPNPPTPSPQDPPPPSATPLITSQLSSAADETKDPLPLPESPPKPEAPIRRPEEEEEEEERQSFEPGTRAEPPPLRDVKKEDPPAFEPEPKAEPQPLRDVKKEDLQPFELGYDVPPRLVRRPRRATIPTSNNRAPTIMISRLIRQIAPEEWHNRVGKQYSVADFAEHLASVTNDTEPFVEHLRSCFAHLSLPITEEVHPPNQATFWLRQVGGTTEIDGDSKWLLCALFTIDESGQVSKLFALGEEPFWDEIRANETVPPPLKKQPNATHRIYKRDTMNAFLNEYMP